MRLIWRHYDISLDLYAYIMTHPLNQKRNHLRCGEIISTCLMMLKVHTGLHMNVTLPLQHMHSSGQGYTMHLI